MTNTSKSDQFRSMVEKNPNNPLFRFSLGQALFEEERWEEASVHLIQAADTREDWMLARILAGKALLRLGRPTEARPWLETSLRLAVEQRHEGPEAEVRALLEELKGSGPSS